MAKAYNLPLMTWLLSVGRIVDRFTSAVDSPTLPDQH